MREDRGRSDTVTERTAFALLSYSERSGWLLIYKAKGSERRAGNGSVTEGRRGWGLIAMPQLADG